MTRALEPTHSPFQQKERLRDELRQVQQDLLDAEAELASHQADINAFRMHCRLKLDKLVDQYLELRVARESLLTRLQLWRQSEELGIPYDEEDPFWQGATVEIDAPVDDVMLPTDTPHDKAAEKRLYRDLARRFHPDLADTQVEKAYRTSIMTAVNKAYTAGDTQALYDLASELDPTEVAELAGMETPQLRQLRQQIMKLRRRRRRAQQRLQALMQENTARLWQRARELDDNNSEDWWNLVRRELETAVIRRQTEIAAMQTEINRFENELIR